jgi:hypothetical protein
MVVLEEPGRLLELTEAQIRDGEIIYCSNNRTTRGRDSETSSNLHRLSSWDRMDASLRIVNGVARGCGSNVADKVRGLFDTAESVPQNTSSEHCDSSSLAVPSPAFGRSAEVASRRRRSAISFSISALRLSGALSATTDFI